MNGLVVFIVFILFCFVLQSKLQRCLACGEFYQLKLAVSLFLFLFFFFLLAEKL